MLKFLQKKDWVWVGDTDFLGEGLLFQAARSRDVECFETVLMEFSGVNL
jgi:hypothetical protein